MTTPMAPRRRDSDHPKRRLEDAPGHQRLLRLIIVACVIGALTLLLALTELRYRDAARTSDVLELRELTEQVVELERRTAVDTRAHRIRTEEYLARLCQILITSHEGVTPSDCPKPLVHSENPLEPADDPDTP